MKIRVYGFKFEKSQLPKSMGPTDAFLYMQANAGAELGKNGEYRYGAYQFKPTDAGKIAGWWGGMILKIRDSKAFTKLTEKGGKQILTAEMLGEHEKLAELTYFIAHPETCSGLLAYHNQGTSLVAFSLICRRVFNLAKKRFIDDATAGKEKEAVSKLRKELKGKLELVQLCNDTDIKSLVKQLRRVTSFELRLATLETKETLLRGIIEKAAHETLKLTFLPDSDVYALAEDASILSKHSSVKKLKVTGYDEHKIRREFSNDQNPLIFDEIDFDDSTSGLSIDLGDWKSSIKSADMITKLMGVAAVPQHLHLLK